ncbi:MAG: DUF692 family protein [Acidobacteria bacterium]|nr:DUF692 family protein [Acidobacteriota bacterium]
MSQHVSLALPVSTLIDRGDPSLVGTLLRLARVLEVRDHSQTIQNRSHRIIYHSDASIVVDFSDEQVAHLARIVGEYSDIEMVSFHVASCYNRPKLIDGRFVPSGRRRRRLEMLETASKNLARVAGMLPEGTSVAIENNNYFPTGAYEDVCDPQFLTDLTREGNLGFVFDWSHAQISAAHLGVQVSDYITQLPLTRTVQVHISAPKETGSGWVDAHSLPPIEDVVAGARWTAHATGLRYVTPEYYRDISALIKFCRSVAASHAWNVV